MKISVTVLNNINVPKLLSPVRSDTFWKYAAAEWHRLYKDYVPMQNGALYNQVTIEPKTITHTAPYAHYQYEGIMYGPNYPIIENGAIAGFFSMPNRKKTATGRRLKYNKDLHPKATREWDKAAAPTQKEKLERAMMNYLRKVKFNG